MYELLLMLQDLRLSLPDVFTDAAVLISSPLFHIALPLAFATFFLWCVDRRQGEWMMMNIVTGMFVSHFMKDIIKNPRPWIVDERIAPEERALEHASGYSTPSGHSVDAVTGYGSLMMLLKRKWSTMVFGTLMILMVFSRLFLGVHTILDVLLGALVAIAVMTVNWILIRKAYDGHNLQVTAVYMLSFITVCTIWVLIADDLNGLMTYAGVMLGSIIGRHIENESIEFKAVSDSKSRKILSLAIGWSLTTIMFLVPYVLLGKDAGYCIGGFLAGLCIFTMVPIILKRIKLSGEFSLS